MRFPSLSEILFFCAFLLFVIFLYFFNSKHFYGEELCSIRLDIDEEGVCEVRANEVNDVRVLAKFSYPRGKRLRVRPSFEIKLENRSGQYKYEKKFPKSGTSSVGNYGVFEVVGDSNIMVKFVGGENPEHISYLKAVVMKNPSTSIAKIFCFFYMMFLFSSIYTRKKVFKNGVSRLLPYMFYVLVVITSSAWIVNT